MLVCVEFLESVFLKGQNNLDMPVYKCYILIVLKEIEKWSNLFREKIMTALKSILLLGGSGCAKPRDDARQTRFYYRENTHSGSERERLPGYSKQKSFE